MLHWMTEMLKCAERQLKTSLGQGIKSGFKWQKECWCCGRFINVCLYKCSNSWFTPGTEGWQIQVATVGVSTDPQAEDDETLPELDGWIGKGGEGRKKGRKKRKIVVVSECLSYLKTWTGSAWWHQVMCHPTPGWVRFRHAYLVYV